MFGILIILMLGIVAGMALFVTADRPFNKRGLIGFTVYTMSWMIGLVTLWP
jgi:hypothetical protein